MIPRNAMEEVLSSLEEQKKKFIAQKEAALKTVANITADITRMEHARLALLGEAIPNGVRKPRGPRRRTKPTLPKERVEKIVERAIQTTNAVNEESLIGIVMKEADKMGCTKTGLHRRVRRILKDRI